MTSRTDRRLEQVVMAVAAALMPELVTPGRSTMALPSVDPTPSDSYAHDPGASTGSWATGMRLSLRQDNGKWAELDGLINVEWVEWGWAEAAAEAAFVFTPLGTLQQVVGIKKLQPLSHLSVTVFEAAYCPSLVEVGKSHLARLETAAGIIEHPGLLLTEMLRNMDSPYVTRTFEFTGFGRWTKVSK